jgi:chemotaxis protein MotB
MSRSRKRRGAHTEDSSRDRWLISYADFVTLLFAVFVVLFAFSWQSKQNVRTVSNAIHTGFQAMSVNPPNGSKAQQQTVDAPPAPVGLPQPPEMDTADLTKELQQVLGDSIDKKEIVMQQTREGLVISLRELGFFNSGEAKLLPGAAEKLRGTAQVLMQRGLELRVEGHSDEQPIHNSFFRSNWELSTARATSVLTVFVEDAKFPPTKISVAGYGPYHPVADNDTPEGRGMNRRVDLVVLASSKYEHTR